MPRPLHSLLLAVLTVLLLVQPAVLAGASCAEEMFTGQCGCEAGDDAPESEARSCCAPAADERAPSDDGAPRAARECGCTLAPVPFAPAGPAHDGAGLATESARAWIDLGAALSAATVLDGLVAPAASDGSPPGVDPAPHDLASRAGAARYLTFLCTSLR